MDKKLNCWEFRNCGMEPGGIFSRLYGDCPVSEMMKYDGINGGIGAGRICWSLLDKSPIKDPFICRNSRISCVNCEFFHRVQAEENSRQNNQITKESVGQVSVTVAK